ncbi:hypothetical protein CALCODRAFT_496916 [Calocera cornea HHB12733]|uniref:TNFR-Cys domain-containing protein n=1 Tax=Calocera cornea HHB12733 TaxID=1353952 RepID=A0A165FHS9_9BASI|nr:hypothetical protein CALCODRAFT_496916 [Calocera cornea HHB12733]
MLPQLVLSVLLCLFLVSDDVTAAAPKFRPSRTGRHANPLREIVVNRQVNAGDIRRGTPTRRQNCPVPLQSGICPDILCSGVYVNPLTDAGNCGSCAHTCQAGSPTTESQSETCQGGVCGCYDADYNTLCQEGCSDLNTDHYNCGECSHICGDINEGFYCQNGVCVFEDCPTGEASCRSGCSILATDASNCGACGVVCKAGEPTTESHSETCQGGLCGCYDSDYNSLCSDGCSDLSTDHYNCGACDHICGSANEGNLCSDGKCVYEVCSTEAEPDDCITGCTNLDNSSSNCGTCGNACKLATSGSSLPETCQSGVCGCYDSEFHTDCPDGCSALNSDLHNCGQCGHVCGDGNEGFICLGGLCIAV